MPFREIGTIPSTYPNPPCSKLNGKDFVLISGSTASALRMRRSFQVIWGYETSRRSFRALRFEAASTCDLAEEEEFRADLPSIVQGQHIAWMADSVFLCILRIL